VADTLIVNVAEAARQLGVSAWTVRRYIADGLLPVVEFPSTSHRGERNRRVLISIEDLKGFRDRYRTAQPVPDEKLSDAALKRWAGAR
jgi:hypothetical protein